jgi:hypothetical protein
MDQNDALSGIEHTNEHPDDVKILESGTYVVIAAPQMVVHHPVHHPVLISGYEGMGKTYQIPMYVPFLDLISTRMS